jgi:DNA-binding LacI/PurR family transcriptional regulator
MTREDVARKAGVSTATLSRVISSAALVRPPTHGRVLTAIAELIVRESTGVCSS